MRFKFFKRKKREEPKTFEGRFISDEELAEMTKPKVGTFIGKELKEIDEMMRKVRESVE